MSFYENYIFSKTLGPSCWGHSGAHDSEGQIGAIINEHRVRAWRQALIDIGVHERKNSSLST